MFRRFTVGLRIRLGNSHAEDLFAVQELLLGGVVKFFRWRGYLSNRRRDTYHGAQ